MPLPSDEVAKTTLVLAAATFLLALFTLVLAVQTRNVARRTEDLAKAAQEQVRLAERQIEIAEADVAESQADARAAQQPNILVELDDDDPLDWSPQAPDAPIFYLSVKLKLVNYGGHALIDRLHITGSPQLQTRPSDVAGLLPLGGQMRFVIRFNAGTTKAPDLKVEANVPVRARGQRLPEWRESLFFVTARYQPREGWRAQVTQPLNSI